MDSNNAVKTSGEFIKNQKVMINRSTSSGFIQLNKSLIDTSDEAKLESENNSCGFNDKNEKFESKFIPLPLSVNDRDIPDFLGANRQEYNIMNNKRFIVCSRSTQTDNGNEMPPANVLLTNGFNHPAIIINTSATRRLNTPNSTGTNYTNQELILTKSQLFNVHRKYQKLKKNFHKLHSEYQRIRDIASVFTEAIEKSIHGEPVDLRVTLQTCRQIYPDVFNYDSSYEQLQSEQDDDFSIASNRKSMLSMVPLLSKYLNYHKIKLHLISASKITLSQPIERAETINEYVKNDLLELYHNSQSSNDLSGKSSILPYLLIPLDVVEPHPLQQSAARLLNTFASFKSGRDYLAVGPAILNVVVQCFDSTSAESIDAFTCDMIIATLQKLSLRRNQRLYMIAAGLVEWLIHHLKAECHTMGTYRLEYATALLMNLSLQKEAQVRAAAMPTILISTLIILLSLEHLPALPYVNGALNNFIANSTINKEAKLIGLGSILEYHRRYRSGELRKHIDHILLRHRRPDNETIDEIINEDDDREDYDNLDDELDEMDPVKVNPGDLFGETLLAASYSLPPNTFSDDKFREPVEITDKSKSADFNLQSVESSQSPRLSSFSYKLMVNPVKLTAVEENNINNGELIDSKKFKVNCSISTSAINVDTLSSHETITTEFNLSSLKK
ncbi:Similar to armc9: LisH domain-containing protein ARMC9 (Danio rerio) [Cotesia congregata]|uniref:Similar to armc9: LisH domain-containing protein ARMC9 (Danio rerio) n=1 Tax=Cotesia congregata TaxID=51543 RepID=A0A8J2HJJ7_COTCN|nr:Similar to armc9: LisH domain-containing protein ARMC9 (Danio rerio) [Cotesia congregata]